MRVYLLPTTTIARQHTVLSTLANRRGSIEIRTSANRSTYRVWWCWCAWDELCRSRPKSDRRTDDDICIFGGIIGFGITCISYIPTKQQTQRQDKTCEQEPSEAPKLKRGTRKAVARREFSSGEFLASILVLHYWSDRPDKPHYTYTVFSRESCAPHTHTTTQRAQSRAARIGSVCVCARGAQCVVIYVKGVTRSSPHHHHRRVVINAYIIYTVYILAWPYGLNREFCDSTYYVYLLWAICWVYAFVLCVAVCGVDVCVSEHVFYCARH